MFDVLIIGGGHAGCEAAWISAQFGLKVGIISMPEVPLASAPCNPAIGGVGKGQVVREIDSLGGLMGRLADRSAIQYRILNESKGYAVQSTRVQIDKDLYAQFAEEEIGKVENIQVVKEKVDSVLKTIDSFSVTTAKGNKYESKKIVVTTGTFLNGKTHTGEEQESGGRYGARNSDSLGELFSQIQCSPSRFKTGTPARLDISTIDFSVMDEQPSDPRTKNFHSLNNPYSRQQKQVSCHLTRTNENTLGIIRDNKERSPIFNGQIKGVGPRYCPSIEDKAFRYEDRNTHHVFVEPEGLTAKTVYPNGISTSLPKEVQESFIQTIAGMENAKILIYGYAVEYDVVDTSKLDRQLQYIDIPGLYFAGQVNGTSGYEEAAGQGLVAGINASLSQLNREPFVLDRSDSYIGVMIEDLVSNVRDEPYRLFTARSENRLYVREDNSINRICPYRSSLGLYTEIDMHQEAYMSEYKLLWELCKGTTYKANSKNKTYFESVGYGPLLANITLAELSKRSKLNPVQTLKCELARFGASFMDEVVEAVAISLKYEGYISRATVESEKLNRLSKKIINWKSISANPNVSNECKQRIEQIKPETFSQLQRIDGIRPATLAFVAGNLV
jgi:tRNA uridine 5-carboxymethylaminomethyl modification enzyme